MVAPLQEQPQNWASHWKKNIVAVITQDWVIDDSLKRQIKNRTLWTCDYSFLPEVFNMLPTGQTYLSIYPPSSFNIYLVVIFSNFSR